MNYRVDKKDVLYASLNFESLTRKIKEARLNRNLNRSVNKSVHLPSTLKRNQVQHPKTDLGHYMKELPDPSTAKTVKFMSPD